VTPIAVKQLAMATSIPSKKKAQTIADIPHNPKKTIPFSINCCALLFAISNLTPLSIILLTPKITKKMTKNSTGVLREASNS